MIEKGGTKWSLKIYIPVVGVGVDGEDVAVVEGLEMGAWGVQAEHEWEYAFVQTLKTNPSCAASNPYPVPSKLIIVLQILGFKFKETL